MERTINGSPPPAQQQTDLPEHVIMFRHALAEFHQAVRLDPRNTSQTCSECGAKAKHRLGLADRTFVCAECGLVLDRDRNAARNLNPDRWDKTVRVGQGVDGRKPKVPAGTLAA